MHEIIHRALFPLRRAAAVTAFRWRERGRNRRRFPTVFRLSGLLAADDISLLKDIEPDLDGRALLAQLVAARNDILSTTRRWRLVSLLLTAYLLLSTFSIDLPLAIEGFALTKAPGLREVATLVIAAIGVALLPRAVNLHQLSGSIGGLLRAYYPPELAPALSAAYFPAEPASPYYTRLQPHLVWPNWYSDLVGLSARIWYVFAIATLVLILWARFTIYAFVWANPSIDVFVSHSIVILAASVDVATLLIILLHLLPVPLRDWSRGFAQEIARETGNHAMEARLGTLIYSDTVADMLGLERKGYVQDHQAPVPPAPTPPPVDRCATAMGIGQVVQFRPAHVVSRALKSSTAERALAARQHAQQQPYGPDHPPLFI